MDKLKAAPKQRVSQRAATPLDRLNSADHTTTFEARLAGFLKTKCAKSHLTLANIKDIVWNEGDHNLISRVVFMVAEENPRTKLEDIMKILNDAWNHFPHKNLNGLAPRDMVERVGKDVHFTPEARLDFYQLCCDRFPDRPRVVKMRGREWSWEFPAAYHTRRTELADMRKKLDEFGREEPEDGLAQEAEAMFSDVLLAAATAALQADPLYFEAATIVAHEAFHDGEEVRAKRLLETSIYEGRKLFPSEFTLGKDLLPWGFVDNRPLLLLLGEYAMLVEAIDGPQKAVPLFEEVLALNPNDNTGIRAYLATALLKTNRLEELVQLDAKYPDDMMQALKVGALLAFFKLGRLDEVRERILKTQKNSGVVFREILKSDHPQPDLIPGRVQVGGADEAWLYWQEQGTFWMAAPGARDFLREHFESQQS